MKKALKIIGITVGSIVALVLVLAGAGAYMLSSSKQLTEMVKKYAPQFVNCDFALDKAKLTLFKTFPEVGIDIENVALIHSMTGSPSDTLANIDNLVVVIDANKFRKEKEIVVKKCILEDAFVNLYTDSLGNSNFDVFNFNKEDDTTNAFDYLVDIEEVKLKNATMLYADDRIGTTVHSRGLDIDLKGKMQDMHIEADLRLASEELSLQTNSLQLALKDWGLNFEGDVKNLNQIDGKLELSSPDINLEMGQPYLEHDSLDLHLTMQLNLKSHQLHLNPSSICLNRYRINLAGDAELAANKDVALDMSLSACNLAAEDVLIRLPEKMRRRLRYIDCSGIMNVTEATFKGVYNDSFMPLIMATVTTEKARVNVSKVPHPFKEVDADVSLCVDMNSNSGCLTINSLKTCYNRSRLSAKGLVDDLLGDIGLKLRVSGNVPMTDINEYVPDRMKLGGRVNFNLATNFSYKQLMDTWDDYNLNRLTAWGDVRVKDFVFDMDTIQVVSPFLDAHWALPVSVQSTGNMCESVVLYGGQISLRAGDNLRADLKDPNIGLSVDGFLNEPKKKPMGVAVDCSRLDVSYDTIDVHIDTSAFSFATLPDEDAMGLKMRIALKGSHVMGNIGKGYALGGSMLEVDAIMNQNKRGSGFINRWNPDVDFGLGDAMLRLPGLEEAISISSLDVLYDSAIIDFKRSTFRIGRSDLSLQGKVTGINEWLEDHTRMMKGELQVTSEMLNINEILDLTRGLGVTSNSASGSVGNTDADPIMVPEGVDFSFILNTKKALYDNFDLNNLNGRMTVKDGTLILQEIGFTNKAAEMKLTAMFQSPRRNNLFLAMDFHLLNVQINDLLHMIPYIDTLVPMLKTFDGQAEFHIGAETNLKANYEPKISTLRAAADIEGKNLSVNDKFTFTKMTDMLDISTNGSYRIDSLDVQLTAFKNEVFLWPSQIAIGKYKVTVDGRMTLDKNGEYHLSVTESPLPTRFGLVVSGPLNNLDYKFEKPKYPNLYKPSKLSDTEEMYIELKKRIADHMKENVK